VQTIVIRKAGGPLGLSIVGGADHASHPFGIDEPGVFVSKVGLSCYYDVVRVHLRFHLPGWARFNPPSCFSNLQADCIFPVSPADVFLAA